MTSNLPRSIYPAAPLRRRGRPNHALRRMVVMLAAFAILGVGLFLVREEGARVETGGALPGAAIASQRIRMVEAVEGVTSTAATTTTGLPATTAPPTTVALAPVPPTASAAIRAAVTAPPAVNTAKPVATTAKPRPVTTTAKPTTTTAKPKPPPTTVKPPPPPPTTAAPPPPVGTAAVIAIIRAIWPDTLEDKAIAIANRESHLQPGAFNGSCCYGLFQIYYGANVSFMNSLGVTSATQLLDATTNARVAYAMYQRSGWAPWGG
jgi:hypothetical protein